MFIDLRAQYERIREDVQRRIQRVLEHGQYILGPEVAELEQQLAAHAGVRHCVAVGSGTDALVLALMSLGIGQGDEVITTPFTFVATSEAIRLVGARPIYADIDPDTYNLEPSAIASALTPRTRAILPVSLFGQCADLERIEAIARRHGLPVIEDAAQSFGATSGGRRSCGMTTLATTSFYPAKPLGGYGEGGACFTNDDGLAQALRELRVHGQSAAYRYARIGLNARLDTLQAAILLAKLEVFEDEIARRQEAARRYDRLLEGLLRTPRIRPGNTSVYAQYTIELDARDAVRAALQSSGIPTAVHYPSTLNREGPYRDDSARVPHAERAAARVLSLPMHPYLDPAQQERVAAALRDAVSPHRAAKRA